MAKSGYWVFNCNPKMWAIDEFLEDETEISTWKVTDWHKDDIEKGQQGLIRVGHDHRTKKELSGRKKLERGIYAVVEVLGKPQYSADIEDPFWIDEEKSEEKAFRVKIKYLNSFLHNPILLDELSEIPGLEEETALVKGVRTSSSEIRKETFDAVIAKRQLHLDKVEWAKHEYIYDATGISRLEEKYRDATPSIKEIISRKIERGEISRAIKKWNKFECQVCKALGLNPHGFLKSKGEPYIETHHFFPVSALKKGSLGLANLMTVCANHHRQLHYGNVAMIASTTHFFELTLDGKLLKIEKIKLPEMNE